MSKPIRATKQMKKECPEEFKKWLDGATLFDGKLKYEADYTYPEGKTEAEKDTVTVVFSQLAYTKQCRLIQEFSSEVAWNGIVRRDPEDPKKFRIEDIIIFPQTVTGATVTPDQKEYEEWTIGLSDYQFNNMRYHGHSHVNMAVSPSGTDNTCQRQILGRLNGDGFTDEAREEHIKSLGETGFYLFMIWNKRWEYSVRLYDMFTNTQYEGPKEIKVEVEGMEGMADFIAEAKSKVKSYTAPVKNYGYPKTTTLPASIGKQDTKPAALPAKGSEDDHTRYPYNYDDYGYRYYQNFRN